MSSKPVTIDMTPTWSETSRILIRLLEDGDAEGQAYARREIQRMGEIIDHLNSKPS